MGEQKKRLDRIADILIETYREDITTRKQIALLIMSQCLDTTAEVAETASLMNSFAEAEERALHELENETVH